MKRHKLAHLLAAALLPMIASSAFAQASAAASTPPTKADSSFMMHAAADGMAEVQMGQMALDKSTDADVKKLAQRIVDDHTKANQTLTTLAEGKHVTLPETPGADAKKQAASLKKLDGKKFDQSWAGTMMKDHKKAVVLFEGASRKASDSDVKSFATATLPTLKDHLTQATTLHEHLALPGARDKAMGSSSPMDSGAFDHAKPAVTSTSAAPVGAPVTAPAMTPMDMPTHAKSSH